MSALPYGSSTGAPIRRDVPSFQIADSLFRLSYGDVLRLRWWGVGSNEMELSVDTRGDLIIPDIGRVRVVGLNFQHVRDSIESKIRKYHKISLIDIQIIRVATAKIHISGLVPLPGIFDLPPGTRLSIALGNAGLDVAQQLRKMQDNEEVWNVGLGRSPSLRRVLIIREGIDSQWCDLVSAFRAGDIQQDPPLFYGDKIKVFPQGVISVISGGANFPGGVEAIRSESFGSYLHAAGEDSSAPYQVEGGNLNRRQMGDSPIIIRFPPSQKDTRSGFAWVLGSVRNPGAYTLDSSATSGELVDRAGGIIGGKDSGSVVVIKRGWITLNTGRQRAAIEGELLPEVKASLVSNAIGMRGTYSNRDATVLPGDSVVVYPTEQVVWVGGQVQKPGYVPWKRGATLEDYVQSAGGWGDRPWKKKAQIVDIHTGLPIQIGAEIQPGAAIVIPESHYMYFEQWIGVVVSVTSLALTASTFYWTVSKN